MIKRKSFWQKLTTVLLVVAIIAPTLTPLTTFALLSERDSAQPVEGAPVPDDFEAIDTADFNPPVELAPLAPGRPKNPAQVLAERRRDDARACQAEASGGSSPTGGVGDWLQGELDKNFGEEVPNILNDIMQNQAPVDLQKNIQRELPSIVSEGLKKELPRLLAPKIQGLTQDELRLQFPSLFNAAVKEALPDIIKNGLQVNLPRIVGESMRGTIDRNLGPGLNSAAEVFVRAELGGKIGQTVSDVFTNILPILEQLLQSINASVEGLVATIAGLQIPTTLQQVIALPSQWRQLTAQKDQLLQQIAELGQFIEWVKNRQANQAQMTEDMIQGLTVSIQQSLIESGTLDQLTDTLVSDISNPVIDSLEGGMDKITANFTGPINQALASIEDLPNRFLEPINTAVNGLIDTTTFAIDTEMRTLITAITKPIDEVTTRISQEVGQRMTAAFEPLTTRLTSGAIEAGNFIAAPFNFATNQINDYYFRGVPIDPSQNYEPLVPNSQLGPDTSGPFYGDGTIPDASGIDFATGKPLPLADDITDIASGAADTAASDMPKIAEGAVANQTGGGLGLDSGSLGNFLGGALTDSFASGLTSVISTGNPLADAAIKPIVTQAVQQVATEAGLTAGGAAAGAVIAVPVSEIGGLLTTSISTNAITGQIKSTQDQIKQTQDNLLKVTTEIKALQIESCTYLKTLKRIQYAFEEKEFIQDPDAKKALGRAVEYHNIKLFENFINFGANTTKGLYAGGGVDGFNEKDKVSLVPKNIGDYVAQKQTETAGVLIDDLDNSNSLFKDQVKTALTASASLFDSTMTQDEYNQITGGSGSETANNFSWDLWLKLIQPQNNPAGAEYLAREELARRQGLAANYAIEELRQGGGFRNVEECLSYTKDKEFCREWETKTLASVTQGYVVTALTSPIRKAESTEVLDDYQIPEFDANLERLKDLSNYAAAGTGSVYNQDDPCPGPEPCSDSGWGKIPQPKPATSSSGPPTGGSNGTNGTSSGGSSTGGSGGSTGGGEIFKPLTLTMRDSAVSAVSGSIIKWSSDNADECRADNNWLNTSVVLGQELSKTGEQRVTHPVNAPLVITHGEAVTGVTVEMPLLKILSADKLYNKLIFDPSLDGTRTINQGDTFSLNFTPPAGGAAAAYFDSLSLVVTATGIVDADSPKIRASKVVKLIQKEIEKQKQSELSLSDELEKYNFTSNSAAGTLTITPRLIYSMTCYQTPPSAGQGGASQSDFVDITR